MLLGAEIGDFCKEMSSLLQVLGWVITVVKIAIPIIIIAYGILDLGKAVMAEKEDETKKSVKRLLWRIVAGVLIFFVPAIVLWAFGLFAGYNNSVEALSGWDNCTGCILYPGSKNRCVVSEPKN